MKTSDTPHPYIPSKETQIDREKLKKIIQRHRAWSMRKTYINKSNNYAKKTEEALKKAVIDFIQSNERKVIETASKNKNIKEYTNYDGYLNKTLTKKVASALIEYSDTDHSLTASEKVKIITLSAATSSAIATSSYLEESDETAFLAGETAEKEARTQLQQEGYVSTSIYSQPQTP